MPTDAFALRPGAVERVIDRAFPVHRHRVERSGIGFDARSLVTGWMDEDRAQDISDAQVIACIAYNAFTDDDVLDRPSGHRFHKSLLAIVAGTWEDDPGVAVTLRHETAPGLVVVSAARDADDVYPEAGDSWQASVEALENALATMVEMGNDLLAQYRLAQNASRHDG